MAGVVIVVLLLPIIFLAAKSVNSSRPEDLGLVDGRLAGCPDSPNCVSTEADDAPHSIAPLTFDGSADEAMQRLKRVIGEMPRTSIVEEDGGYLRAEFTTLVFRYVDDVEFLISSDSSKIGVRSASRTGYSDLGTNRRRIETIRSAFSSAGDR